jgi:predicted transcriptional regulator of viral defense system
MGAKSHPLAALAFMDPINRLISAVAVRQNGNITIRQLLDLGLSRNAVSNRVKVGLLHRVFPGVYHVGTPATTPLERAAAAVLACGEEAALSHASAMTHWGFWSRWDKPIEVTIPTGHRRPKGIRVHRSKILVPRDTAVHHWIRVTRPARTLFDVAPRLDNKALARSVNNALHTTYLKRGHLVEQLQRHPTHPAASRMLPFVVTKDGPTRSDWERAFPAFCARWKLPKPIMGYRIGRRTVDAFWEKDRIIIELDSIAYHLNPFAFVDDRSRDKDHLTLRLVTVRVVWEEMHETPREEAARLHAIIEAWR